ncbi:hypothetical protein [Streptomyces sp. N35]|uniref:hypothetical protein n=1 Tax=Streptomyces sp. N35 TaxID=2795730 RepID=UPI001F27C85A|nr:hypothetical protein [Streptomyces sp. N35]
MSVRNTGTQPLELTVEPWAEVHHIPPGETVAVVTHAPTTGGVWPGSKAEGEAFGVDHHPDSVSVWANGNCFHLTGQDGNAIDAADWDCPAQRSTP